MARSFGVTLSRKSPEDSSVKSLLLTGNVISEFTCFSQAFWSFMNENCAILVGGVRLSQLALRGLSQKSSYTIVSCLLH